MEKLCFPPLLPPGFHDLNDAEIKTLCVDAFPKSARRSMLYCNYIQLMSDVRSLNQQFKCFLELWVDGSFTTEKPEPDDIDILLVIDFDQLNLIPVMFQPQIECILNRKYIKNNYHIDLLLLYKNCPRSDYDEDRMHWRGVFCHDREDTPKGVARLSL
ncbi:TPA: hypothetical protein ACPZMC_004236 [Yersinia enterocolitica]|uniref:Polymerase nucleotidyl transferase domain-containing protein n=1 Tax=Yersinia alsatica TaxID=2890317 RepID=A0ABY5URC4_9GAMM|nr:MULTISPECIES: hypothetical protein [Yersinia]OWF68932.1 hypothetical protein B4901_10150 [Yersinia frederiksenii]EKN3753889.1 hypothetical protein [Yersinia enterocolitica]EKN3794797.1 hypothetical protein [Yersinia enterocolitica]EKN3875998.1 hypothetical protein [Yersinia enterocolitica]EKN4009775.1 hypothetical protein [Yersinia enterocolitica]